MGVRTTFFWKELETCGFLQKFRSCVEHVSNYKLFWAEPILGAKKGLFGANWSNGHSLVMETGLKRVETGMFHFKLVGNMNGHVFEV